METPTLAGQPAASSRHSDALLSQSENPPLLTRSSPARVCFLIDRLDTAGTESQLLALIRNLDRSRVEPFLVLLDGEDEASRTLEPAECPPLRLGVKKLLAPRGVAGLLRFARFLREKQIDVLQVYFPDSTYFGVLAGRLAGVKAIVRTRNNINHWMTPAHRRLGRLVNRFVTVTVCNSQAARDAVLADERPDPASVIVIENGVDLERFASIPPVSPEPDPYRPRWIGMVANLRPVKGVDILVRAAAQVVQLHPDVEFHIAGEGPQRSELELLIAELGLNERFVLHGKVEDIPAFLASLDVAVLSSRAEGMPNAVLEYMAAGRPIVATAVGGTPALLQDGVDCRLTHPENPKALADCLIELLSQPREASRLASAAREHVRQRYSRSAAVHRFEKLFGDLSRGSGADHGLGPKEAP